MANALNAPHLQNEDAAFAYVEARLWPNGPVCPHCGGLERISRMGGKATRKGLHKCYQCRKQFTVRHGDDLREFARSAERVASGDLPDCRFKEGHQLAPASADPWRARSRRPGSCRTASAKPCAPAILTLFGSDGGVVEVDETFIGTLSRAATGSRRRRSQDEGADAWLTAIRAARAL